MYGGLQGKVICGGAVTIRPYYVRLLTDNKSMDTCAKCERKHREKTQLSTEYQRTGERETDREIVQRVFLQNIYYRHCKEFLHRIYI